MPPKKATKKAAKKAAKKAPKKKAPKKPAKSRAVARRKKMAARQVPNDPYGRLIDSALDVGFKSSYSPAFLKHNMGLQSTIKNMVKFLS